MNDEDLQLMAYEAWLDEEHEWYDISQGLLAQGWVHYDLDRPLDTQELEAMRAWLVKHYPGQHETHNDEVLLPTERDMTIFKLVWA